jgi:hypothetical protein
MLNNVAIFLIIIAFLALIYKFKFQYTIKQVDGSRGYPLLLSPLLWLETFLPVKYIHNEYEENRKRKRANIAIYIFYIAFITTIIISFFIKN